MLRTIQSKMLLGFAMLIASAAIGGGLGLWNMQRIQVSGLNNTESFTTLQHVSAIRESLVFIESGQRGYLLTGQDSYLSTYKFGKKRYQEKIDSLSQRKAESAESMAWVDELQTLYAPWLTFSIDETIKLRQSLNNGEIDQSDFLNIFAAMSGKPIMDKMQALLDQVELTEKAMLEKRTKQSIQTYTNSLWAVGIVVMLSILAGVLITLRLSKLLQTKLATANQYIRELANGQLSRTIQTRGHDEIDILLLELSKAQTNLRVLINGIRQSAQELDTNSNQVSSLSQAMAKASDEQAEATSTMAAAVEELTVSISHISENTLQASNTAQTARNAAESGITTLNQVVGGIERIAQSVNESASTVQTLGARSNDISEIISTITEIADHTNLLALNAAIEAARAGDHGRGFAVVADEVRKLAEQTKTATHRISSMIYDIQRMTQGAVGSMDHSVKLVQTGLSQANKVNATILDIQENSERVSEAIATIAVSMGEQSQVSVQISQNVERVARMTEENTQAAQHNTRVAQQLHSVSNVLMHAISTFK
ncbi:MAG: methyl-accepting chemotaxis protein [Gammaproteobacteria bacterium]|uniref:methyl-accepting chemotaxis protein n=1 Tax=Limnobacter sp. TaxID=2003368 RepID=UPI001D6E81B2|nr:methyl-accepting chemotaxis protein [Limnobacter sp.]MBU0784176.1 methyl-accepting chemotaxis protein [Gammaproteobacteria bacterium]MBU0848221.1 methyl-accepting chemotaxis protein [Gammaproteobacteria bacterium]MBU1266915.1 methyl-accepting chemotaxis protein [Gammaproteobacteria bacterium]MBU1528428.1 methyl-accepting chemotaxis protein [Gammaproteobacteria bacterium]MBU1779117.1 methyl-accepting chemotaxis protein [Gammaproteobacteria bacterium]